MASVQVEPDPISVTITIPGQPVGKASPRVFRGVAHIPKKSRAYMDRITIMSKPHFPVGPWEGPVSVQIQARFKMVGKELKRNPRPPRWKDTKPDPDNIAKSVLDGLNGVAYWDDAQVVRLLVTKIYQPQGVEPELVVTIEKMAPLG